MAANDIADKPTNEKRMPFNDLKTNEIDKGKNNTHKQRTLPTDERLFRGSNVHETDINGCQKMAVVAHTQAYAALV